MVYRHATRALPPLLLALAAAPSAFATTAVSGQVNQLAQITVNNGGANAVSPGSQQWTGTPTTLTSTVSASAADPTGTVDTAGGSVSASWASADAGSVTFTNYGWSIPASALVTLDGVTDWAYTFTATGNGTFSMNYGVTATGDTFGLWGWSINLTNNAGWTVSDANDPTTSGVYTGALVSGETYTVSLENNANINGSAAPGSMDGEFDWSISTAAVPEPDNLALMLAGLALAGVAARRRAR